METAVKPIKRSKELAPLSREHHQGLLFVWKIRQGISNKVAPNRIASFCQWFWVHHLHDHFKKEEQEFIEVMPAEHPLLAKMLEEHTEIRNKIQAIEEYCDYDRLYRLAQVMNYHIRFEERCLFKYIECLATKEQLLSIEDHSATEQLAAPVWIDEFWMISKN